jgi:hypothetical protein
MDLERVTVALRPRGNFEAIDLGFRMALTWWRPVWGVWLVLFLPVAIALHLALPDEPFWAAFALMWLKPLFDRFVLHVISRRVFGTEAGVFAALAAWREVLTPGLFADLTWRRLFAPVRSFVLPVTQLERSTGAVARRRRQVLGNRTSGHAFALWFACLCFELVVFLGLAFLVGVMLQPGDTGGETEAAAYEAWTWWTHFDSVWYVLAVSLIEPFFVAAGFALYLNRRVGLEAWDVELALRRLERRLSAGATGTLAALVLTVTLVFGGTPVHADDGQPVNTVPAKASAAPPDAPRDSEARRIARELFADPVFGDTRERTRWRLRERDEGENAPLDLPWLETLVEAIAKLIQFLGWLGIAAIVIAIVVVIARWYARGERTRAPPRAPPAELFGLAIAPESLPADIEAAALAACRDGDARLALSLIYRGALSVLVHGRGIRIAAGAVEADVLRAARGVLTAGSAAWFAQVLDQWIAVAWARQVPDLGRITALAGEYNRRFILPAQADVAAPQGAPA